MSLGVKQLLRPTPLLVATALMATLAATVQPAAASGGFTPGVQLRCKFDTQAPAPGSTPDRRFQEVRLFGSCNRPVELVPQVFVDGRELEVEGNDVGNKFRFVGASALVNLTAGSHTLEVVIHPRDPSIRPFTATWTFSAR